MSAFSEYYKSTYHGGGFSVPHHKKRKPLDEDVQELTSYLRSAIESYQDEMADMKTDTDEYGLIYSVTTRLSLAQEQSRNGTDHSTILKDLLADLKANYQGLSSQLFFTTLLQQGEEILDSIAQADNGAEEEIPQDPEFDSALDEEPEAEPGEPEAPTPDPDVEGDEPDNEEFNNLVAGLGDV